MPASEQPSRLGFQPAEAAPGEWPAAWAWGVLVAAMAASSFFVLWFARGVGFTADEVSLVSRVAEFSVGDLLDPYVGHLVAVPLLTYKAVIETVGTGSYVPFQLLTLLAIFLLGAGVLCWGSRRLPQAVALAPAVLLVFFPADVLHFIAGNGFTIVLPLALGVWALVLWDRDSAVCDIGASVLLALALATYTVGVAFAAGFLVGALIGQRRRIWVAGLPLLAYALWRLLIASNSTDPGDVGPVWSNLLLLPAWAFQSVGGILNALLGIGFDFTNGVGIGDPLATDFAGPVLAVLFLAWLLHGLWRGPIEGTFWIVSGTALALFASQVLVWGSLEGRGQPAEERYLYPGAVVVLLVAIELGRTLSWDRLRTMILWSVIAIALVSAAGFLIHEVDRREAGTGVARSQVTAIQILASSEGEPPQLERAKTVVKNEFDPRATSGLPGLGFPFRTIPETRPLFRKTIDAFLITALDLRLEPWPFGRPTGRCQIVEAGPGSSGRALLPVGGAVLRADRTIRLRLGRFAPDASRDLGEIRPDRAGSIVIPRDRAGTRWFVQSSGDGRSSLDGLVVCRLPRD